MPPAVCAPRLRVRIRDFHAVVVGLVVLVGPIHARGADGPGTVSEMPLPGGIRGALAVIDESVAPDRSQFLLEFIRRIYHTPFGNRNDPRDAKLRALLAYLDRPGRAGDEGETVPLPLPAATWTNVVFGGRPPSQNLVAAILRSRSASLLYSGLLSLDDSTRAWLTTQPDLITEIVSGHAAAFLTAAPGLRVANGIVRVPGGQPAEPVWQALAGHRTNEPADFVRALISRNDGRLASIFGSIAELTPGQIRLVLALDSTDTGARVDAGRRLLALYERLAPVWRIEDRTFWRPPLDPVLLAADLRVDSDARPILPGTRRFWLAAFGDPDQASAKPKGARDDETATSGAADGQPAEFVWLCEQVFKGDQFEQRRRYHSVLFASRNVNRITPDTAHDVLEAVRAMGAYPALTAVLERAKLDDMSVYAAAARRASLLSAIGDDTRAARALAQFQGALTIVTRATSRGSIPASNLAAIVSSLSAVDVSERGDYEGRLVRWLDTHVRDALKAAPTSARPETGGIYDEAAGPAERDLLRMLSGPSPTEPRFVEWEGTRYRLDFALAEATRLVRVLGDRPRPYVTSAQTVVQMADAMEGPAFTRDALVKHADALERMAQTIAWDEWEGNDAPGRYREVTATMQRTARDGDVHGVQNLAPSLRLLADDLLARGLMELAYAAALGQPDRGSIVASEAAGRHDFGLRSTVPRRYAPWRLPVVGASVSRGWHIFGSLLGLDVSLADFAVLRLSSRPPPKRPTLNEDDRRTFIEAVPLTNPATLTDGDRDTIVAAMQRGRARLAAVRTPEEAAALADEIRLSAARRTLLSWVVVHDPSRAGVFLSPTELFWLGLEKMPMSPAMQMWGVPGEPRLGCLCLQMLDRRPWEMLAGRWSSGIFASGFSDLNLRLSELLAKLQMPAALLAPVLASASLDFVNNATSRDQDDRRGLVEFVQGLRDDRVEQYLGLLTTDGPLVPLVPGSEPIAGVRR